MKHLKNTILCILACILFWSCKQKKDFATPAVTASASIRTYNYMLGDSIYNYQTYDSSGYHTHSDTTFISRPVVLHIDSALKIAYYDLDTFVADSGLVRFSGSTSKYNPFCVHRTLTFNHMVLRVDRVLQDHGNLLSSETLTGYLMIN